MSLTRPTMLAVALGVDRREVAAVHPAGGVDRFARALLVFPVAAHHGVAARAQLAAAGRPARCGPSASTILTSRCGWMRPTVETRRSSGSSRPRLERDRRRLGHAVGDRHLAHVHPRDHLAHRLDRARRARHDAGAQRRQVVLREARMLELAANIVGTPCSAVQRYLASARSVSRGVEALAGKHHRRAGRRAAEHAEHHAEAVVQRHRDAEPVVAARAPSPWRSSARC